MKRKNRHKIQDNKLAFGKYKTLTIEEIYHLDPLYLIWLTSSSDWFKKNHKNKYYMALHFISIYNSDIEKAKRTENYTKKSGLKDILEELIDEYENKHKSD